MDDVSEPLILFPPFFVAPDENDLLSSSTSTSDTSVVRQSANSLPTSPFVHTRSRLSLKNEYALRNRAVFLN